MLTLFPPREKDLLKSASCRAYLKLLQPFPDLKKSLVTEYSLADSKFPNRTTEIYLVRHGQSIHNEKQIIAGQLDSELTGQGIEDARFVAGTLRRSDFDLIYCSDLRRARETTQVILDILRIDCPLKLSPLLRELNY